MPELRTPNLRKLQGGVVNESLSSTRRLDPHTEYWQECIGEAFNEAGITATKEQVEAVASIAQGAHENYGMAFYQPENPLAGELRQAKADLAHERKLVVCEDCGGSGRLKYNAGPWGVNTQCSKCRGNGKHLP